MINSEPARARGRVRTAITIVATALVCIGLATIPAAPAGAKAAVGYVRLAHLSPDTPEVDVYLSKSGDSSFAPQVFHGVGYGVISNYLALPIGTYAVSMRLKGAPESTPPVLTTSVEVSSGGAYTVAGVGKNVDLGLTVLDDDLSAPDPNKAKVRIIQASIVAPVLDVALANGTPVATGVAFATTTSYRNVDPGQWTLRVKPTGSSASTTLYATLNRGAVYSLLVVDGKNGLRAQLRVDARGPGTPPDGAVEAGAGGGEPLASSGLDPLVVVVGGLALLLVLLSIALRMRRLANKRP